MLPLKTLLGVALVLASASAAGIDRPQQGQEDDLQQSAEYNDGNDHADYDDEEGHSGSNETWGASHEANEGNYYKDTSAEVNHDQTQTPKSDARQINITVKEINVRTWNSQDSDLDEGGDIDVEIIGPGFSCTIRKLDNPNTDDFESGSVNIFIGTMLGGCEGKNMTSTANKVKVTHYGSDSWGLDWIKLVYSDYKEQICQNPDPSKLLKDSSVDLTCNHI